MLRTTDLRVPGLAVREHVLDVPLDHGGARPGRIDVFAREVADPDGLDRPFLAFFQGGPGFEATRPSAAPVGPGWLARALRDFRVLLLDQRGTGRSTPVGTLPGTPAEQAASLTHFRADAIVADAEAFRAALGVERWSVLGQSFGGFCVLRYLSAAPEALREAFVTGGLPPVGRSVDDVYAATYASTLERVRRHFARYPADRERVLDLRRRIAAGEELVLPSGDRLTAGRVRALGLPLGMRDGPEKLHGLLELDPGSPAFRHDAEAAFPFTRNPIYALLHEASWADGGATRWSAARTLPERYAAEPELLVAEHVLPATFDDAAALRPLRAAADLLAEHDWPRLYDPAALQANEVPVAAAVYAEDVYVPAELSLETARLVRGLRPWITNEHEHDGLRASGEAVLDRLIAMARGRL